MTHICVGNLTIIGSDNGLSPGRRQAITWNNVGILLIWPLKTNFSEIWNATETFSFKKRHLKMSSGIYRPFCLGLNMLSLETTWHLHTSMSWRHFADVIDKFLYLNAIVYVFRQISLKWWLHQKLHSHIYQSYWWIYREFTTHEIQWPASWSVFHILWKMFIRLVVIVKKCSLLWWSFWSPLPKNPREQYLPTVPC